VDAEHDDRERARQADVLRALLARFSKGDPPLPIDVFAPLERELELRLDQQAIAEAWAEQGSEEAEAWTTARDRLLA
jgi:hypothetical protein